MNSIPVVFRRRVDDGIVALFPTLPGDRRGNLCRVYGPDGWGTANYDAVVALSFPAQPAAYLPIRDKLAKELNAHLIPHRRASLAMHKERLRAASRE